MISISFEVTDEPPRLIVTERMPYDIEKVWLAQTEALYVQQWWAPSDYKNDEAELSAEVGGAWRVIQRDDQGNQFAFYGRVEEITPRKSITFTMISELFPDTVARISIDFVAGERATLVVTTYEYPSQEELDHFLLLGGVERVRGASQKLDALLSQMST